jgi:peptidoglycan/xylan/chitin deacetylase (PgdA/CDA1 family)
LPLAALTFDDGFQSVHDIALPLLVARGLPATCFVNTDAVGSATPLWFGRLHDALSRTRARSVTWGDSRWELDSPRSRERASGALQDLLKWSAQGLGEDGVPRIDTSVDAICRSLDVNPDQPCPADSPFRPCDEPSLHRLAASGLIEVGGHGRRHVILSQLNRAQQRAEIVGSVEAVRSMTGQRAGVFAYPNGLKHDYDEHTIAILRAVGVGLAVTARTGTCSETSPTMELPRVLLGARSWRETLAA